MPPLTRSSVLPDATDAPALVGVVEVSTSPEGESPREGPPPPGSASEEPPTPGSASEEPSPMGDYRDAEAASEEPPPPGSASEELSPMGDFGDDDADMIGVEVI